MISQDDRQEEIVKFCKRPRTTKQIMEKFELGEHSIYKYMRSLRGDGYIIQQKSLATKNNQPRFYIATGKPYIRKGETHDPTGFVICGVRF